VSYERRAPEAGETQYGPFRLFGLAWEAITSLSVMPLRLVSAVGALVAIATPPSAQVVPINERRRSDRRQGDRRRGAQVA
jgi:hypothetical protein